MRKSFQAALFILLSAIILTIACQESGPQKMKVLVESLNGNIWKFNLINVEGRNKNMGNLPTGLYEKTKAKGKHKMLIGMILFAEVNTFFNQKGIQLYKESHPKDILWVERSPEPGTDFVWLFLEKGTEPDPHFIEIVE